MLRGPSRLAEWDQRLADKLPTLCSALLLLSKTPATPMYDGWQLKMAAPGASDERRKLFPPMPDRWVKDCTDLACAGLRAHGFLQASAFELQLVVVNKLHCQRGTHHLEWHRDPDETGGDLQLTFVAAGHATVAAGPKKYKAETTVEVGAGFFYSLERPCATWHHVGEPTAGGEARVALTLQLDKVGDFARQAQGLPWPKRKVDMDEEADRDPKQPKIEGEVNKDEEDQSPKDQPPEDQPPKDQPPPPIDVPEMWKRSKKLFEDKYTDTDGLGV